MGRGNFPVWHDSDQANTLREAVRRIEAVIDWGREHIDDSGQFDNAAEDGSEILELNQAIILIQGRIDRSPEEKRERAAVGGRPAPSARGSHPGAGRLAGSPGVGSRGDERRCPHSDTSVEYVRRYYGMPWLRWGLRVTVDGEAGMVVGARGPWIRVRLDGAPTVTVVAHPTWRTVYYARDGATLGDFTGTPSPSRGEVHHAHPS